MKKPPSAAPAPSDADRPAGGRALQRVRQFELQRGIAAAPEPAKATAAKPVKAAARRKGPARKTP